MKRSEFIRMQSVHAIAALVYASMSGRAEPPKPLDKLPEVQIEPPKPLSERRRELERRLRDSRQS